MQLHVFGKDFMMPWHHRELPMIAIAANIIGIKPISSRVIPLNNGQTWLALDHGGFTVVQESSWWSIMM